MWQRHKAEIGVWTKPVVIKASSAMGFTEAAGVRLWDWTGQKSVQTAGTHQTGLAEIGQRFIDPLV